MLAWILALQLHAADATRLPGGYVTLVLPSGFTPASSSNGFEDPARATMITTQRLPKTELTLEQLPKMMEGLQQKVVAQETTTVDGKKARLVYSEKDQGRLWVMGLDAGDAIDLVFANFREPREKDRLRGVLLTARVVTAEIDPFDGAPFRFEVEAPLKPIGGGYVFTADGRLAALPMITLKQFVAPANAKLDAASVKKTFEKLATERREIKNAGPVKVGTLDAFEITGSGKSANTATAFDALLLLRDGKYILVEAQTVAMRAGVDMPKMRTALFSLRPNTK